METAIYIFQRIQSVLGTLQITSTRSNLDTLLGCMQLCDKGIEALTQEEREDDKKTDLPNEEKED